MKKETRDFLRIARSVVGPKKMARIMAISDEGHLVEALQFALRSSMENVYHVLREELNQREESGEDLFFAKMKLMMFPPKLGHIWVEHDIEDYRKAAALLQDVHKELRNGG